MLEFGKASSAVARDAAAASALGGGGGGGTPENPNTAQFVDAFNFGFQGALDDVTFVLEDWSKEFPGVTNAMVELARESNVSAEALRAMTEAAKAETQRIAGVNAAIAGGGGSLAVQQSNHAAAHAAGALPPHTPGDNLHQGLHPDAPGPGDPPDSITGSLIGVNDGVVILQPVGLGSDELFAAMDGVI